MKLFSSILSLLLAPALNGDPQVGQVTVNPDKIDSLQGKYWIDFSRIDENRPSWASIWKLNKDVDEPRKYFSIATWPPEYCHAVYVCPVKEDTYTTHMTILDNTCEDQYIKFYPHIKKLLIKTGPSATEIEKFWMSNRLRFDLDTTLKAKLHVHDTEPPNFSEWKESNKQPKTVDIELKNKDLLILTNSRMCQVNKIGGSFYPLFGNSIKKDPVAKIIPNWFFNRKESVPTLAIPPEGKTPKGKTVDLLSFIKTKTQKTGKLGGLDTECGSFADNFLGGTKKDKTVDYVLITSFSYGITIPNQQWGDDVTRQVTFETPNCQWFRIWFTEKDISQYTTIDLSETLDVFVSEGFYVTPESDVAHPLPDRNELTKFTFRAMANAGPAKIPGLIQMSYGDANGKRIYYEYFKAPVIDKNAFKMHVFKAPGCDMNVESSVNILTDRSENNVQNMWQIRECTSSYFI